MTQPSYASRLRYLAADQVEGDVNYNGLDVRDRNDDKIGDIEGFIVDVDSHRLRGIVIDSGGWFTGRQFLLPPSHAVLAEDRRALRVDITRDVVSHYPDFDRNSFLAMSDEDFRQFNQRTTEACCPDTIGETTTTGGYDDTWPHYHQPPWWRQGGPRSTSEAHTHLDPASPDRDRGLGASIVTGSGASAIDAGTRSAADTDWVSRTPEREMITARETWRESDRERMGPGVVETPERDPVTAPEAWPDPDRVRAQPGDVLGIERDGETTHIGDTADEEDRRRREGLERANRAEDERARERDRRE